MGESCFDDCLVGRSASRSLIHKSIIRFCTHLEHNAIVRDDHADGCHFKQSCQMSVNQSSSSAKTTIQKADMYQITHHTKTRKEASTAMGKVSVIPRRCGSQKDEGNRKGGEMRKGGGKWQGRANGAETAMTRTRRWLLLLLRTHVPENTNLAGLTPQAVMLEEAVEAWSRSGRAETHHSHGQSLTDTLVLK
jgi:hypothetical protein